MSRLSRFPVRALAAAIIGIAGQPAMHCRAQEAPAAQTPGSLAPSPPASVPKVEAPPSAGQNLAREINEAFISVFDHVAPAVVVVDVSKEGSVDAENNPMDSFGDFFFRNQPEEDQQPRRPRPSQSEASGFIIQPDGYILTNQHVIAGWKRIDVRLKDGRSLPAKLIGSDEKTDIAVIKIEAAQLPSVEFADSEAVRVGQLCFAIGVPFRQDYTFTQGVVSAKNRSNLLGADKYEDYIQTDASINPGNSGGPLLDLDGHVIGMNTLINGLNRGLGFSIPSNMLRDIGTELIKAGRIVRPYLGVRIMTLTEDSAARDPGIFGGPKKGVIVSFIELKTPAYKSDLRAADIITEVDGVPVTTERALQKQILSKKVGSTVQLTVFRKGKTLKIPVTTGELPDPSSVSNPLPSPANEVKEKSGDLYGLQVQELTKELAESLGIETDRGVIVTSVAEDSPAARAGIHVKDVITEVGEKSVSDADSLKEALKKVDPKHGIDLYLSRGGSKTFVVLKGS